MSMFFHSLSNPLSLSITSFLFLTSKVNVFTVVKLERELESSISFSSLLPQRIKEKRLANFFAVASPIPEVAPVINAFCFVLFFLN